MAPQKFDDLHKTSKDVLIDDYTEAGKNSTSFKSKVKTNFEGLDSLRGGDSGKDGAHITSHVDFNFGEKIATPAKLTWKFPKPIGANGIAFDKLEMDKAGKAKLEAVCDMEKVQNIKGLKFEFKTDLNFSNLGGTAAHLHYSGIDNVHCKVEVNAEKIVKGALTEAKAYKIDATYGVGGGVTLGGKHSPESPLDVGMQYHKGPAFFSAMMEENFAAMQFHGFYKLNDEMKLAAVYNKGGKKSDGVWGAGVAWDVCDGTHFKGKLTGKDNSNLYLHTAVKQTLAKGFSMTASTNVPLDQSDKAMTWGLHFSVE